MYLLQLSLVMYALCSVYSANILAVFPTPAHSHHVVYKIYIQALAKQQHHNITVIKPNILNYMDAKRVLPIREINADMSAQQFKKLVTKSAIFRKRGAVSDASTVTYANYLGLIEMFSDQFNNTSVRNLINSNETFDLIIVEAFAEYSLVFGHFYSPAPVIQIAPGYGLTENFETAGAVARHPIHYPNIWRSDFQHTTENIAIEMRLYNEFRQLTSTSNVMLKKQFGPNTPTIQQLRNNVQLLLLNLHPVFDNNRPVPPSVQYLGGGLHLTNSHINKLNTALDHYMNSAKKGVIYVSFGATFDTNTLATEFKIMLINLFARLDEYTIFWKIDEKSIKNFNVSNNVYVQSWFNQRAILNHKKTVAFLTQGGLQSTDEAIEAQIPMLCLPMMGDQFYHSQKLAQFKVARVLDTSTVTASELLINMQIVINDSSYKENIKKLYQFLQKDKISFPPIDKALHFTEKVLQYGRYRLGSLKTTAANGPHAEYFMYETMFSTLMNHFF
ncbi:EGT [Parapoynx stagnalis nucleopolyhedrovirus]|uniref:Ecdysteroid UDP-glucosyltransferase n=1 Tax=Parapoynx stagnalis nucleopolyhedrovirus TaxID=2993413 RepID=A0A9E8C3A8_9ABAC|nr:EGT [Parapoynx stagnalis nucleopolyhedrovirus]